MAEITDVLKDIVETTGAQDAALLKLCQAMADRIIAIEKREDMFMESQKVMMDILKVHTDTNQKIREVMKSLVSRVVELEEHTDLLLQSVVVLKEEIDRLTNVEKGQVH